LQAVFEFIGTAAKKNRRKQEGRSGWMRPAAGSLPEADKDPEAQVMTSYTLARCAPTATSKYQPEGKIILPGKFKANSW
jgi:hypothetical protein